MYANGTNGSINESMFFFNNDIKNGSPKMAALLIEVYPYVLEDPIAFVLKKAIGSIDNKEKSADLGHLYEMSLQLESKKDYGKFYTQNNDVIEKMIMPLDLLSGKILEPACGSGLFLIKIIEHIINQLQEKGYSSPQILDYICENIYANDCDKNSAKIAELNILAILMPLMIDAKKYNDSFKMKRLHISNFDFTQRNLFGNKFSLIIGNPPFVTMYGKHSRNMTEDKRMYYNTFDFVQNKNGNNKFNLSMFFVENALKSLNEGGKLSYILDIAFFERAFMDLRRYIVQNYFIDSLIVELQEFKSVASGQLMINIINTKAPNRKIKLVNYTTHEIFEINQTLWDNPSNQFSFSKPLNRVEEAIVSKLNKYDTLDKIFPNKSLRTCCALTGKTDEFIVDFKYEKNHDVFPYIEGSKGLKGKFFEPTPSRYIKYDYDLQIKLSNQFKDELSLKGVKNKKRVTLGDKKAYLSPKLFIRQSATEIIATYCDKPYAANNSIYILSTKQNSKDNSDLLKYACGLLNSDLITFYCRISNIIRMRKGKTPQIKISDLKNIRLAINVSYYNKIIILVEQLLQKPTDMELKEILNKMVYDLYEISNDEVDFIQTYLRNNEHSY